MTGQYPSVVRLPSAGSQLVTNTRGGVQVVKNDVVQTGHLQPKTNGGGVSSCTGCGK